VTLKTKFYKLRSGDEDPAQAKSFGFIGSADPGGCIDDQLGLQQVKGRRTYCRTNSSPDGSRSFCEPKDRTHL
jgi:hypothetical protein